MICTAYTFGTFSKISEFVRFGRRLEGSIQRRIMLLEYTRNRLIKELSDGITLDNLIKVAAEFPEDTIVFHGPSFDNRDLDTQVCFNSPTTQSIEEITRLHPLKNDQWVIIHSLVLSALKSICSNQQVSSDLLSELEQTIKQGLASSNNRAESYLIASKFLLDAFRSEENSTDLRQLFPSQLNEEHAANLSLDYSVIANVSLVLEALLFQRLIWACRKHKPGKNDETLEFSNRILAWLQAKINVLAEGEQLYPTEVLSDEPLSESMLPITAFVIEEKSASFINNLFQREIVGSWLQSLRSLEKICLALLRLE